jgi:Spy/CpxP family protein refolding chaperone
MKKIVMTMIALLTMTAAVAQNNENGQRRFQRPTPEDMTNRMADQLKLDDKQKSKVLDLNKEYEGVLGGPGMGRGFGRGQGGPGGFQGGQQGQRPELTEEQRAEMRKQMQQRMEQRQEYEKKLKDILTDDQYKTYQEQQQQRRGRGGFGGPRGRRPNM